jgi:pyridoxamine 5'-phosphate oxidase family protein
MAVRARCRSARRPGSRASAGCAAGPGDLSTAQTVKFLTEGGHRERVTDGELGYLLGERRLARDRHRRPGRHPPRTPVGWTYNAELDTIDVGGHSVERTKKFRDVVRTGRAAVVIDDVLPPLAATRAQGPGRAGPRPSGRRRRSSASAPNGSCPGALSAGSSAPATPATPPDPAEPGRRPAAGGRRPERSAGGQRPAAAPT